jgi:hypothetical protein
MKRREFFLVVYISAEEIRPLLDYNNYRARNLSLEFVA